MILFQAVEHAESKPENRPLDERGPFEGSKPNGRSGFWHRLESLFGVYAELLVKGIE